MWIGTCNLDEQVLVVAEIGNNHEGNVEVARELVRRAAECGVDAVKFQTFRTEKFVSKSNLSRYFQLKSFELAPSDFGGLAELARSLGLAFISTPLDLGSLEFLKEIVDALKIASGDNNFYPLIERAAATGKPLIISAGLADLEQIAATVAFVERQWMERGFDGQLAVLHCVSSYPAPPEQANVLAVRTLRECLKCEVGYSDHTAGIDAAVLAVALGARIIEKHFTLGKNYSNFRDHHLSADPGEMRILVEKVRLASLLLGVAGKSVQPCEIAGLQTVRRSIAAGRDMPKDHRLALEDLTWLRPADGLAPGNEHFLLGRRLKRDVQFGEFLHLSDVEEPPT